MILNWKTPPGWESNTSGNLRLCLLNYANCYFYVSSLARIELCIDQISISWFSVCFATLQTKSIVHGTSIYIALEVVSRKEYDGKVSSAFYNLRLFVLILQQSLLPMREER